jgi:hypothetical protein
VDKMLRPHGTFWARERGLVGDVVLCRDPYGATAAFCSRYPGDDRQ